jgi:hypothetical protein
VPTKVILKGWVRWVGGQPDFAGLPDNEATELAEFVLKHLRPDLRELVQYERTFGFRVNSIVLPLRSGTSRESAIAIRESCAAILRNHNVLKNGREVYAICEQPAWRVDRNRLLGRMSDAFLQSAGLAEDRIVRDWNQGILWLGSPAVMLGRSSADGSWIWFSKVYDYVRRADLAVACENF